MRGGNRFAVRGVGVLFACLVMAGLLGDRASAQDVRVFIDTPVDGSFIELGRGEGMPARRPVAGHVEGVDPAVLAHESLVVEIQIRTDRWYPQGFAKVDATGDWTLRTAHFGGLDHVIRAVLMDRQRNPLASAEVTVTLVQ